MGNQGCCTASKVGKNNMRIGRLNQVSTVTDDNEVIEPGSARFGDKLSISLDANNMNFSSNSVNVDAH